MCSRAAPRRRPAERVTQRRRLARHRAARDRPRLPADRARRGQRPTTGSTRPSSHAHGVARGRRPRRCSSRASSVERTRSSILRVLRYRSLVGREHALHRRRHGALRRALRGPDLRAVASALHVAADGHVAPAGRDRLGVRDADRGRLLVRVRPALVLVTVCACSSARSSALASHALRRSRARTTSSGRSSSARSARS